MKIPDKEELDIKRSLGLRPQVVACFINDKKVFLFYDQKYDLWQFPQGGIEKNESPQKALKRETEEELGISFSKQTEEEKLFAEAEIVFPKKHWGKKELMDQNGQEIEMKGKYYYAFAVQTKAESIEIEETQFNDYLLASASQAKEVIEKIYQKRKREVSMYFLEKLVQQKIIS